MDEKYRINAVTFVDGFGKVRVTVSTSETGDPFIAVIDAQGEICAIFAIDPEKEPYISRTK
jgi:hypothetical protein